MESYKYWIIAGLLGVIASLVGLTTWHELQPEPEVYIGIPEGICETHPEECGR